MLLDSKCAHASFFVVGGQTDSEPGTEGDQGGSEQEGNMAGCEHSPKDEHASYGPDRGDTSRSQESGDHDAAMGNLLGSALTYQLHQPEIYKALGMDRPPTSICL